MNILITGNLGYLGSVLTNMAKMHGHNVHGIDNGMQVATLIKEDMVYDVDAQYQAIKDLGDTRYDVVYHLAAISNDPMGDAYKDLTHATNVVLVEALCAKYPNARHVLASSASVYGAIPSTDIADERYPFNPLTAYAVSKVEAEKVVRSHWDYSILRMGTLWGGSPNFRRDIVVNAFMHEGIHSGIIRPKAQARRPMLHVADAARTMMLAGRSGLWTNRVVNVGAENTTVSDIAKAVAFYLSIDVDWSESKEPDKRDYAMDCSRYNSISAELAPLLRVGDIGAMAGVRSSVLAYGKPYPTRLEQLRTWFDNYKNP